MYALSFPVKNVIQIFIFFIHDQLTCKLILLKCTVIRVKFGKSDLVVLKRNKYNIIFYVLENLYVATVKHYVRILNEFVCM